MIRLCSCSMVEKASVVRMGLFEDLIGSFGLAFGFWLLAFGCIH